MELGSQIKKYRNQNNWSQEELAEKVYVSRQTVSNWENEKSYPDIHSIILLGTVFNVSLDELIKGDVEIMRKEIRTDDINKLNFYGNIMTVFMIAGLLGAVPLVKFLSWYGLGIVVILWGIALFFAFKAEKIKKENDIGTYKEIVAFMDGKHLDEIAKAKEEAKRPYQNVLKALVSAVIALVVCGIMGLIFGIFG
ncbi:MAG: helix-turn-helix transcriptional regulator [Oscillospiraceae bacterium]|nr:helix-turn-helix transcriptional regulator [Oscillospiraceae bacterium]